MQAGAARLVKRRPFAAAIVTAFALLLSMTLPTLLAAPLTTMISARIIVRVFFAWLYACIVFAGAGGIFGVKGKPP